MKRTIDLEVSVLATVTEKVNHQKENYFLSVIFQALLDATSTKPKVNKDRAIIYGSICSVSVTEQISLSFFVSM